MEEEVDEGALAIAAREAAMDDVRRSSVLRIKQTLN